MRPVSFLFVLALCGITGFAQSGRAAVTPSQGGPSGPVSSSDNRRSFQTESYRVVVDSIEKKANNYWVTLVFENLTKNTLRIKWLQESWTRRPADPRLVDEKGNKYVLNAKRFEGVLGDEMYGGGEVLPGTNLKLRLLFVGPGNGQTFELLAIDYPANRVEKPISIKGLKITTDQDANNPSSGLPSFATESYRVVVSEVRRDGDDITLTLVFESLSEKTIKLSWGLGSQEDNVWESQEPYLIDENADRYYLRKRDDGKVVSCLGCGDEDVELLPGTKLKTHFVFNTSGKGSVFTLACKERRPKGDRPVVISGLRPNPSPSSDAPVSSIINDRAESRAPEAASTKIANNNLEVGLGFYRSGKYAQSLEPLLTAILAGQEVRFPIAHRHMAKYDHSPQLCFGELIFTRDSVRFENKSQSIVGTTPSGAKSYDSFKPHDFAVSIKDIYETSVQFPFWAIKQKNGDVPALSVKIIVRNGNKEEKKDNNFYSEDASVQYVNLWHAGVVRCPTCQPKLELLASLLQKLIERS